MKYFVSSVRDHIIRKLNRLQRSESDGHKMFIMVPTMSEKIFLLLADALTNYCLRHDEIVMTFKIAKVLTDGWTIDGQARAEEQGWLDDRGSLTFYRSLPPVPGKLSLIVLCGVDRVTDATSLFDFHTCNVETIWQSEMKRTFRTWVEAKLKSAGIYEVESDDLKSFDRLLKPLLDYGRADLTRISTWLAQLDLTHAHDAIEAQQAMLVQMDAFGLPSFVGFPVRNRKKSLAPYIDKAGSFFSYTLFLEPREREKAEKAINRIIETVEAGDELGFQLDNEDVLGPYSDPDQFLSGLRDYVLKEDKGNCQKLLKCDFVTILDKILKYRKKGPARPKGMRRISGNPVEMILTALWESVRDFYQDRSTSHDQSPSEILITSDFFRHDIEGDEDEVGGHAAESEESAREYLSRLIGGLDHIVASRLSLKNAEDNDIAVSCSLVNDNIKYRHSNSAEPRLEFSVDITCVGMEAPFRRKFAWRLPENHSYRLSTTLLNEAKDAINECPEIWKLPVFHLPYYDELLGASADEEVRRVFLHSLRDLGERSLATNLLSEEWLRSDDALMPKLKVLAETYHHFIKTSAQIGLLRALFEGLEWGELRRAYSEACKEVANNRDALHAPTAGMLLRSFLVVQRRTAGAGESWHADGYEQSGIVTVLHPALLEMLEAQIVYLIACFNYAMSNEMKGVDSRSGYKLHVWRTYVDLAEIQAPIAGLLRNEEQNLDASVRGEDLIHRIGLPASGDATLSTRLLTNYSETPDDEEAIADSEMFRETSESKLLLRLMLDYFRLHPHASDGFGLAVYRNKDIQPVISAVHHYLGILADPKRNYHVLPRERRRPYAISVTFFNESSDDADVSRWIQQWQERWEAAETESKYQAYRECRFSIAHRLIEKGGQSLFQRLINENFEADIAVFYDFVGAASGVNKFEQVEPLDITTRTLKFPILEKACCTIRNPADQLKRSRVISNRQFGLGTEHANLMHCLKNKNSQRGTIVVGTGDFAPWRKVIDILHEKTEWVICVDPNIDERLIAKPSGSGIEREIIGFGSGVGTHGEDNYTVSTEQFALSDVNVRLSASIASLYAAVGWTRDDSREVAEGVLRVARELSGLSLVRATGVDDRYIHDFMAYAITRKILRTQERVLCDNLISLDAYRHWFDLTDETLRPDLIWLVTKIGPDKRLHLEVRLIECKMGNQSTDLLAKARAQIDSGLRVLVPAFAPLKTDQGIDLEDNRPDRRYWWMQLHRLIASKAEIERRQYQDVLSALERLAEGDYEITWGAAVFAFWINSDDAKIKRIGQWECGLAGDLKANIYVMGSEFVRQAAVGGKESSIDWTGLEGVDKARENVCETMEEVEFSPGEGEEDDTPWDESDIDADEGENEGVSKIENDEELSVSEDDSDPSLEEVAVVTPANGIAISSPTGSSEGPSIDEQSNASPENPKSQGSESQAVGVSGGTPGRILLGLHAGSNNPVYWEFGHPDLHNRHMVIFGASGTGKTYAIQCLLCEMGLLQQNSLIIDYTNGFLPNHLEVITNRILRPEQHVIRNTPLPINPFLPQSSDSGGIVLQENANSVAKRIAGIISAVYQIGDQQFSVLHRAIMEGVECHAMDMNFDMLLSTLDSYSDDRKLRSPAQSIYSKIRPFVLDNPFAYGKDGFDWDSLFTDSVRRCHVFQLAGLDMYSTKLVTEFILWDLYGHIQAKGKKTDPKVIVLDEVQNLDHREGTPLYKYLTEGRKFGISLILATQTMSNMKRDEKDRMFGADHKLFFKPADTELKAFADIAAISTRQRVEDWVGRLANLRKGECYSIGRGLTAANTTVQHAQKIRIASLEERGFDGQA
ncbi:MAG: AAA-like domain protein [Syntrophorhabdus sp. PtaU1.Bin153]|nr:MAG: AAA-like domain protein [Syntrophorhabdus sp. PtaU1.Bin153]